jgi:hypothetical protein
MDAKKDSPYRKMIWTTGLASLAILAVWCFPRFWYSQVDARQGLFWLAENTQVQGRKYKETPPSKSAEAVLVADRLVSGEFWPDAGDGEVIRVFSAKRYNENLNDIGLFVHTPDRCWTEAGWRIEPSQPEVVSLEVSGIWLSLERRIFVSEGRRELVYFGGLVGGQQLPYRLDHNLSVGIKKAMRVWLDKSGTALLASDSLLWQRVWDSFASRRPMLGPKQFIRVSTSIADMDSAQAEQRLRGFLPQWLRPVDFKVELRAWRNSRIAAP